MPTPVTLPFPADDLRGKLVRFSIRVPSDDPEQMKYAEGVGVLLIDGPNDDGKFIASISVQTAPDHPLGIGIHRGFWFEVRQELADVLRRVPMDESGAELECVDPRLPANT